MWYTVGMKKRPQIILSDGRPSAVILDIGDYEALLEQAEEAEDLRILRAMRRRPLRFRKLEDFLKEQRSRV